MIRIRQNYWSYIQLARLDKPIGIWLVFFPALWSLIWVSPDYHTFFQYVWWICLGAVFARSVGCIINDGWDRNLDAHVQRTAQRPMAAGNISRSEFMLLLVIFGILALGVLAQFNLQTILWGLAVVPLIILYPLMKRWTYWPQAFLAITFNWGALVASTAVLGYVSMGSFIIYLACACWTMAYDTIYAHQDVMDDLRIGIKSTALRFGKDTKLYVVGSMSLFFVLMLFVFIQKPYGVFIGLAFVGIWGWSFRSLLGWTPDDPVSSRQVFLRQNTVGWLIAGALGLVVILPLLSP